MKKRTLTRTWYRDRKTGKFASKKQWSRSSSGRFVRVHPKKAKTRFRVTPEEKKQMRDLGELLEGKGESIETLYYFYKDDKRFKFKVGSNHILKVSISTVKTRTKFSVRL